MYVSNCQAACTHPSQALGAALVILLSEKRGETAVITVKFLDLVIDFHTYLHYVENKTF